MGEIESNGKLTITTFCSSPNLVEQYFNSKNNMVRIVMEGQGRGWGEDEGREQKKAILTITCVSQSQEGCGAGSDGLNRVGLSNIFIGKQNMR